jgi:hypothetical protein
MNYSGRQLGLSPGLGERKNAHNLHVAEIYSPENMRITYTLVTLEKNWGEGGVFQSRVC